MDLQQLPPEIIYHIISFLPSLDIVTMASFYCRPIREWSLVLMNERAQQSMLQGWRLMVEATTIKPLADDGGTKYEQDREYVCAFAYIDAKTLDMYFSIGAFGKEGFGAIADSTTASPRSFSSSSSSPIATTPPEQQQQEQVQQEDQLCIPMPFEHTNTTIQISILKEKVPTKLLEFAATLSDDYSFQVSADDYQFLRPKDVLDLSKDVHPQFSINYTIERLAPVDDGGGDYQNKATIAADARITPPSPPSQQSQTITTPPDIALRIKSLKLHPTWWWTRTEHQHYSNFLGLEHQYW